MAERLKRLQTLGMVIATIDESNRRRKYYEPTELGRSFTPVLKSIARWGLTHLDGTAAFPGVQAALATEANLHLHDKKQ